MKNYHPAILLVLSSLVCQTLGRAFDYLGYNDIVAELTAMATEYPHLMKLDTAEDLYGTPSSGRCGKNECREYIVQVTDQNTYESDPTRPEVFFSGTVHGDERIGPTATVEFIKLLLTSSNPWVRHLVNTRNIVVMPMANAPGYSQNRRTENGIDINRDFPIDSPPAGCMRTAAAKALNALFKDHMFQLAITFHSGIEMITYTWGSQTSYDLNKHVSPDDLSQGMLGSTMSAYAGSFQSTPLYPHARMNDIIYPVRGGMEDWAYASSWPGKLNPHRAEPCSGYESQTVYTNDQLRIVNILVETSKDKTPHPSSLGTDVDLLSPASEGNGHIPRNIRLMLLLSDVVQPYVQVVSADYETMTFSWEVGGAFFVDATRLVYRFRRGNKVRTGRTRVLRGPTRWSVPGKRLSRAHLQAKDITLNPETVDREENPFISQFTAKLRIRRNWKLEKVWVMAKVDRVFKRRAKGAFPQANPQSHWTNARSNPKYHASNNGREIVGKVSWTSKEYCIEDEAFVLCPE